MVGHRSNKTVGSSLIVVYWQIHVLHVSSFSVCCKLLIQHCCVVYIILLPIIQSRAMYILVVGPASKYFIGHVMLLSALA